MALEIIRDPKLAPLEPLRDRPVAVIGYGNQGRAHALNLRDSGLEVIVGSRETSRGARQARLDNFTVHSIDDAASSGRLVIIALPDMVQPELWTTRISPNLGQNAVVGFIHGFAIRYGLITPEPGRGVVMVAPKGPGATLRARYVEGTGIPCLLAVEQESDAGDADALALAWAAGIGCARAGIIRTTFAAETETDLFGEQAVLCGGLTWLVLAAFETLVDAGYPPELAYLECCHEVKQIADLVYARGVAGMMDAISNTAEFGAHVAGPAMIDANMRRHLADILEQIRDGSFAQRMRRDYDNHFQWFSARRAELAQQPIDEAGATIRKLMPWLRDQQSKESR